MKVEKQVEEGLKDRVDLVRIMDAPTDFLASRDTDADSQATVFWHLKAGLGGEPTIGLELQDEDYKRGQWYMPNQLVPADIREYRLVQLWNDVLQQRTHRQFKRVNELISQMED